MHRGRERFQARVEAAVARSLEVAERVERDTGLVSVVRGHGELSEPE